ncbi:MAG: flagellin FliC [Epsilonproteobacteria bacterium]|nr:MAG: flagellin FliC [Campylobacterota bacterium]RLA66238.1 MAG: flagellin FliC [Campylobacterota bacterium]
MGLRINTNISALIAQRHLKRNFNALSENLTKLSSGKRIVKAGDDAAGLAISSHLQAKIAGNRQAERNANDGISLIQVTEGGLNEASNILIRMRELAIQSSSDTIGNRERALTQIEFRELQKEIERLSRVTEYNGTKLLSGQGRRYDIQVGVHNTPADRISYDGRKANISLQGLGMLKETVITKNSALKSLNCIDWALTKVSAQRATLGAVQNRLNSAINNLQIETENIAAANSRIMDVDYAHEIANNARLNILTNASVAALAQANLQGQQVLKLIG